ncbi:MAG: hypothetical protein QOG83_3463 [Alphaproteobacteria bacterium]|nr:hypothetical protein [Alphaproteobacteria bacterium]
MFDVGDIVQIFAPQAGKVKYHLCISVGVQGAAHQFIYLNSDPNFDQTFVCDCKKIPCLPESKTGKTAFSFAILPRYTDAQLKLYNAKKLGVLDAALAIEVHKVATTAKTMTSVERKIVLTALEAIIKSGAGA